METDFPSDVNKDYLSGEVCAILIFGWAETARKNAVFAETKTISKKTR